MRIDSVNDEHEMSSIDEHDDNDQDDAFSGYGVEIEDGEESDDEEDENEVMEDYAGTDNNRMVSQLNVNGQIEIKDLNLNLDDNESEPKLSPFS